jgi:hypothetical protein
MADLNGNQQADQAAFPYPAGVLPPEHEETDTTGTTTTAGSSANTKSLSDVQRQAEAGQDAAAQGAVALTGEQRAQKEKENAVTADIAGQTAEKGAGYANEYDRAMNESQKMIDAARSRAQVAQQRLDNQPPASYFKDGDTWGNALRGFALALGAAGDAKRVGAAVRTGQAAPTLDTVGGIIQADLQKQKDRVAELKDRVVMAHTGIDDAFKARQQMMQDIDLRGSAAYAQLERIGRARLAALGMSQPEIDQHQAIQAIQEKRAEQHAKYVEPLYNEITKHIETAKRKDEAVTNRTNTSMQGAMIQGALEAPQLNKDLETVAGYSPGVTEKMLPRAVLDAGGQQFEDASGRLATHLAVKLVGPRAGANPEVVKEIKEQYLPSATDTPEARAAKIGALRNQLSAQTLGAAGRPAPTANGAPAAVPNAPASGTLSPMQSPQVPATPQLTRPQTAPAAVVPKPPVALDRPTLLRALASKLQEARVKGDPRAAAIEARIREVVRGG